MIYKKLPQKFFKVMDVVSCYLEYNNKILLLRRCKGKVEEGKWGLPAGKIKKGENKIKALCREVKEETSIKLKASELKLVRLVYVKHPAYHYNFYMYRVVLKKLPVVKLKTDENVAYKWVLPKTALKMKLIRGQDRCFKIAYNLAK